MPAQDIPVPRRQLGQALRTLRQQADLSREHIAGVLDCSVSRVGHIESGLRTLRKLELDALMPLYGASAEQHETLERLRQHATRRRGWAGAYRLPPWLRTYIDLEADAETMRSFEGELIPGLLQTEEYSRRVHLVAAHLFGSAEIDRFVAVRKHRQLRITEDESRLEFSTLVSEAAFRRALGDPDVGRDQVAHVIELAQRLPNVTLQILPFADGLHASMSGSFSVLTFSADVAPPFGYEEHAVGGNVVDDPRQVQRMMDLWELLRSQALPPTESLDWLSELLQQE